MIRIIIPLLVFLLVVNWRFIAVDQQIVKGSIASRELNSDIECPIHTDQLAILEGLYKCSGVETINHLE
jgi:hypothetical protein